MPYVAGRLNPSPAQIMALIAVVAMGIGLRCLGLQRALWIDEAWVIDSVRRASLHDMFFYPDWAQTTPPGVLLLLRAIAPLTGVTPEHFRYLPFVVSVITLLLVTRLCLRWLSPGFALLAMVMLASSPEILWYSTEIKQYAFDLLAATSMLALGAAFIQAPSRRRWHWWIGAYGVFAGISFPVWFYLPALMAVAFAIHRRAPQFAKLREIAAGLAGAGFITAVIYFAFARPNADVPTLRQYWNSGFYRSSGDSFPFFFTTDSR